MRNFFILVWGGLTAVGTGILIAYLLISGWNSLVPSLTNGKAAEMLKKTMVFNAAEEEDAIMIAAHSELLKGDITAKSYFVRNITGTTTLAYTGEFVPVGGGSVIAEKDAETMMPIASITKLVTAVIVNENIPPNARITLTRDIVGVYGNTANFKVGETFKAQDLMYPLLMVSSNDAAEAFARYSGRNNFIKAMNDFAQEIGAYRTYFADPSGLSKFNVSTAKDVALILEWIAKNRPQIMATTQLKTKTIRDHTWVNPTHFLSWTNYAGGKNGYTTEANRTAASLFRIGKNNELYAVVILGSKSRDSDEFKLLNKIKQ